jgi:hypothetical protein
MLMNTRDDLIIKLAALQVKYYGDFDPEFIKEAVTDIGAQNVGVDNPSTMWVLKEQARQALEKQLFETPQPEITPKSLIKVDIPPNTDLYSTPSPQVGPAPSITSESASTHLTPSHNASNAPTVWDVAQHTLNAVGQGAVAAGRGLATVGERIGQGLAAVGGRIGQGVAAGGRWLGREISEGVERAREGIHNSQTATQAANTAREILRENPNAHILATSKGSLDKGVFYTSAGTAATATALAALLASKKAKSKENR